MAPPVPPEAVHGEVGRAEGAHGERGDLSSGRREAGSGFPSHKGPASANTRVRSFMAAARPAGTAAEVEMKHAREQGLETWQLKGR